MTKGAKTRGRRRALTQVLRSAVRKMKAKLESDDFKPTVGDFLKLVEAEKEYEKNAEEIKELKITWVDQTESEIEK
jgi:hypothetical protein